MSSMSKTVRVLMISRDRLGLDPSSLTATRWKKLAAAGAELEVWVLAAETSCWEANGIRVSGTGGQTMVQRLWRAWNCKPAVSPDLVTTQDLAELGFIGWQLAKCHHAKLELQDHGGWFDGSKTIDEPLWAVRSHLGHWLIRRADLVRTVNPASYDWLKKHVRAFVYWLAIVPRDEFRELERAVVPGRIVWVGRLVPVKRVNLLLKAFVEVLKMRADTTLILVGDGPERASLEALAVRLGVKERVQFVGSAHPASYLSQADVFTFLSSHEGWGVAPVEAALTGVPVVMSDTGAARWLAAKGAAKIVEAEDAAGVAAAIIASFGAGGTRLQGVLNADEAAAEQVRNWKQGLSL